MNDLAEVCQLLAEIRDLLKAATPPSGSASSSPVEEPLSRNGPHGEAANAL